MAGRTTTATLAQAANGYGEASILAHNECLMSVQDVAVDGPTTIHNGPALLFGIYVNTVLSAHTVTLNDAAVAKLTLPASLAAGSEKDFRGARFETSLIIAPNASSTGNVTVFYRPI